MARGRRPCGLTADISVLAHRALFVRDAGRLPVLSADDVPPRRCPDIADRSALLHGVDRAKAGEQWPGWWRGILTAEARRLAPAGGRQATHDAPGHPGRDLVLAADPGGAGRTDPAELWKAARALRGVSDPRFEARMRAEFERRDQLTGQIARTARHIAHEQHASINTVRACVLVLLIDGVWWSVTRSGTVVVTLSAVRDDDEADRPMSAVVRCSR